LQEDEAIILK